MAPAEEDCLDLDAVYEVLERDGAAPNLLITGRGTTSVQKSELSAVLARHVAFYEDKILKPELLHTELFDFREYPYLPPAGVVQEAISFSMGRKEEIDRLQVAMAVVLADSFWSAGARTIINLFTKAVPPASPFLICTSPEKAREFFQEAAATRKDLLKAGGSTASLAEELRSRRSERFVSVISFDGTLPMGRGGGSFISASDLAFADGESDPISPMSSQSNVQFRAGARGETRVTQGGSDFGHSPSMARASSFAHSPSIRGRRTRFVSCREALADDDERIGMRHLAGRGNIFFAVDELMEEEPEPQDQDEKEGRSSSCCGTGSAGNCSIL